MIRPLATLTIVAALSACVPSEQMIDNQRSTCAQIGYAPQSPEFLACVERGVVQGQAAQNATAATIVAGASTMIIADALWGW
jgi:hypothetical protein